MCDCVVTLLYSNIQIAANSRAYFKQFAQINSALIARLVFFAHYPQRLICLRIFISLHMSHLYQPFFSLLFVLMIIFTLFRSSVIKCCTYNLLSLRLPFMISQLLSIASLRNYSYLFLGLCIRLALSQIHFQPPAVADGIFFRFALLPYCILNLCSIFCVIGFFIYRSQNLYRLKLLVYIHNTFLIFQVSL